MHAALSPSMNVLSVLNEAVHLLKRRGYVTARLDAEVLLSHCLKTDRSGLYSHPHRMLTEQEREKFQSCMERREGGEPVAYIIGEKEFWSLPFEVNYHVLIPRPETEVLVEVALTICHGAGRSPRILEVGTGCGAISISLARELKEASIIATDISREALYLAMRNARRHGVEHQISFREGDLFQPVSGLFDLIVSNPPYIPEGDFAQLSPGVREFEPKGALVAGIDGHRYHREIALQAASYLEKEGWLLMEIGAGQQEGVKNILKGSGHYDSISFRADYAGIPRVSIARRGSAGG